MAGDLNRVQLIGRVGQDPEIRNTSNGKTVATLSIATSDKWRDRSTGERKERTEWHRVVVWNEGLVGVIENYVRKGALLFVEGKLQTRKWQDQEGRDRYSTEIVLQGFEGTIQMLGGNRDGGDGGRRRTQGDDRDDFDDAPSPGGMPLRRASSQEEIDDEVPF